MQPQPYGPSMTNGRGQRGQLEQLADGRWRARYRENGRDGKRPQFTHTKRDVAARWLRQGLEESEQIHEGDTRPDNLRRHTDLTANQAVTRWLATLDVAPPTMEKLASEMRAFTNVFGERKLQSIGPDEIAAWRLTLSPGRRSDVFAATKRLLRDGVRYEWLRVNPADGIRNPRSKRPDITPLPWEHAVLLSEEIDQRFAHVPILGHGTGLRPEEWLALERRDIDLNEQVIHVRRVWSSGILTELGRDGAKTRAQRRRVPLRRSVSEVLERLPRRIDTPLLVPATRPTRTGHMTLSSFRDRFWRPAFQAAGLTYQRPYDMRHAYASESIAAGINLFELSRYMGTSLKEIDATYGHLVADSDDRNRLALDAYDEARAVAQ